VTDTTTQPDPSAAGQPEDAPKASVPRRSTGGLGGKVLAELQEIAGGLDIAGASKMRKGELIDAIKAAQGGSDTNASTKTPNDDSAKAEAEQVVTPKASDAGEKPDADDKPEAKSDDGPKDEQKSDGGRNRNQGGGNRGQGGNRILQPGRGIPCPALQVPG